jgi:diacylglycerol kinase family enzyme
MRIDVVVNPRARLYQRDRGVLDRVRDVALGRATLHVTESLAELDEVCDELARRGTDLVVVSGGDGSLMAAVTALDRTFGAEHLPAIAPVPGGTAGTVARNWGIAGEPSRFLARLLSRARRRVRQPSLLVTTEGEGANGSPSARSARRVGFIVGTGLVAQFFRLYYERGAPGYSGSARLVARIFLESFVGGPMARRVLEPLPCELEVEGKTQAPRAWSLVCASVVPNLGIHMLVTYRGGEDPKRPHLVATPMRPSQLGPRAPLVLAGRPLGGQGHVDCLAERFTIRFAGGGPFVLDGELLEAREVVVGAGPELTIVRPA